MPGNHDEVPLQCLWLVESFHLVLSELKFDTRYFDFRKIFKELKEILKKLKSQNAVLTYDTIFIFGIYIAAWQNSSALLDFGTAIHVTVIENTKERHDYPSRPTHDHTVFENYLTAILINGHH